MATLQDYGIRLISHGAWSDPEIEWKKSKFQTLLFNYWDVVECTDYEELCNSTNDADLQLIVSQLYDLEPCEYACPHTYYEWEVSNGDIYEPFDDDDYRKDARLSRKDDIVLHTTSQALRQALIAMEDVNVNSGYIRIFRCEGRKRTMAAYYFLQGSTLKDCMH